MDYVRSCCTIRKVDLGYGLLGNPCHPSKNKHLNSVPRTQIKRQGPSVSPCNPIPGEVEMGVPRLADCLVLLN